MTGTTLADSTYNGPRTIQEEVEMRGLPVRGRCDLFCQHRDTTVDFTNRSKSTLGKHLLIL